MGRIAKFIEFIASNIGGSAKGDIGGGDVLSARHFSPPGDDSTPLAGDYALFVDMPQSGVYSSAGYIDSTVAKISNPGEKRIYARSAEGVQVAEIYIKNSGDVSISNTAGSFLLEAGGNIVINGVTITPAGQIITPEGVTLNTHKHSQGNDSDGNTEQDTGGPENG